MPIHGYPGGVITANPVAPTVSSASGVWTTEQQLLAVNQGNWPGYEYPISRSLRFNSADSAYLSRTPAGAGTPGVWTFSFWVKRAALGVAQTIFYSGTTNQRGGIRFTSGDLINCQPFNSTGANASWTSTAVFRDPSAWYHVVIRAFSSSTGNSFGGVELALYINGVQQTFTLSTAGTPTGGDRINDSQVKHIGQITPNGDGDYLSAYLTEFNFVGGQALEPSSFGLNDPETGVWSPKRYTGTYGTNGFYLNFSDNSGTTSTTLGKDYSGNGNNWTPNNFSVTAGAGNDSLVDTPTSYGTDTGVGGEVRGNYATFNPLQKNASISPENGNLELTANALAWRTVGSTIFVSSGKWYIELTSIVIGDGAFGLYSAADAASGAIFNNNNLVGATSTSYAYLTHTGQKYTNASGSAYGSALAANDVLGLAFDADAGTVTYYKNGVSLGQAFSGLSGSYAVAVAVETGGAGTTRVALNFGQRAFAYTAPSGFKALCTQNLPTPTIGATSTTQADDYFDAVLWSGDSSLSRNITGWDFNLDFLWVKQRNSARDHWLVDRVRGVQKGVVSNSTAAESTDATATNAFVDGSGADASGFTAGNGSAVWVGVNGSGNTYVGWGWKANGAGSSNTAGTITSTVSANTTSGFSIVTYTGNGSAGSTVGHGLGASPSWVITKSRSNATNWMVWTDKLTTNYALEGLNTTGAEVSGGSPSKYIRAVSSTTFTIGDDISVNQSASYTYVAYCFAPVAGYSAFGSYTGNGSADGPFVYTGFRPAFVLVKYSSTTSYWIVFDNKRNTYNLTNNGLQPNDSAAENSNLFFVDFLSNGFKARDGGGLNGSGQTAIYAAFAESPFKYSLAR